MYLHPFTPTSALDLQTEKEVQESLDKLLEGRTAVIIAHRLSTVQGVDYVYCMEDGCVVGEGIRIAIRYVIIKAPVKQKAVLRYYGKVITQLLRVPL